jgi:hypothetical protein
VLWPGTNATFNWNVGLAMAPSRGPARCDGCPDCPLDTSCDSCAGCRGCPIPKGCTPADRTADSGRHAAPGRAAAAAAPRALRRWAGGRSRFVYVLGQRGSGLGATTMLGRLEARSLVGNPNGAPTAVGDSLANIWRLCAHPVSFDGQLRQWSATCEPRAVLPSQSEASLVYSHLLDRWYVVTLDFLSTSVVILGLGCIVASYHRSSTSYQIH